MILKTLFLAGVLVFQPVHVTMTSIDHVPGTDSLKVFLKMDYGLFLRDYQTIDDDRDLHKLYAYQPFPSAFVNNYINSKLFIHIDNKLLFGKLLDMNLNDGEVSFNFLYRSNRKPKKITVSNNILTALYGDQVNMTIIRINNIEKGIKLTSENSEETFILK
jgi:hypothetical protein